jgi:heat shock protein HslJ
VTDPATRLEGVEWRLLGWTASDGAWAAVPAGIVATAVFADGVVAGSTGCNRYRAPYRVAGASIEIGPAATTMMACDPDRTTVERAFTAALERSVGWAVENDDLDVLGAGGAVLLRFAAVTGPALIGTEWIAIGINNGRGAVVSAVAAVEVTATFGEDGRVGGSGGCNRFVGPYATDGRSMAIGPLASTRMTCPEPERVGEQEGAYLAALERATSWSIREDRLQLRSADGALEVDFRSRGGTSGDRAASGLRSEP